MKCRAVPYSGSEPYIFLSYCHKDASVVYPLLEQLVSEGYRIWFDDGIHTGDFWEETIAAHIQDAAVVLAMLTENASNSHNCRKEIFFASDCEKKVLPILLEPFQMSVGMKMQLCSQHYLKRYELESDAVLLQKICIVEEVKKCKGPKGIPLPPVLTKYDGYGKPYSGTPDEIRTWELLMYQSIIKGEHDVMTFTPDISAKSRNISGSVRELDLAIARDEAASTMEKTRSELLSAVILPPDAFLRYKKLGSVLENLDDVTLLAATESMIRDLMEDILYLKQLPRRNNHDDLIQKLQQEIDSLLAQQKKLSEEANTETGKIKSEITNAETAFQQQMQEALRKAKDEQARFEETIRQLTAQLAQARQDAEAAKQKSDAAISKRTGEHQNKIDAAKRKIRTIQEETDQKVSQSNNRIKALQKQIEDIRKNREANSYQPLLLHPDSGMVFFLKSGCNRLGSSDAKCDIAIPYEGILPHNADILVKDGKTVLRNVGNGTSMPMEDICAFHMGKTYLILISSQELLKQLSGNTVPMVVNRERTGVKLITRQGVPLNRNSIWPDGTLKDPRISRKKHALLRTDNSGVYLEDQTEPGKNGTYLNGEKLNIGQTRKVFHGDVVRLGQTELDILIMDLSDNSDLTMIPETEYRR